jgi:hypothetical protein
MLIYQEPEYTAVLADVHNSSSLQAWVGLFWQ